MNKSVPEVDSVDWLHWAIVQVTVEWKITLTSDTKKSFQTWV